MANITVRDMMEIAIRQNNYKESPAGSNNTKFGKWIGVNYQPWCASYEAWCGNEASKKYGGSNPIYPSANAADIQDYTVSKRDGKWIMKKTGSVKAKLEGFKKAKEGDIIDFDFGAGDSYRRHTGLVIGTHGNCYITIEGNTTAQGKSGSQSNGGQVAIRTDRKYTEVCSIVRPKYGKYKKYKPTAIFTGSLPKLPKKGYLALGDKGKKVKKLQNALIWAMGYDMPVDGKFGNFTLACVIQFQIDNGLLPDGDFGSQSMSKMQSIIEKYDAKYPDISGDLSDFPAPDGEVIEGDEKVDEDGTEKPETPSDDTDTTEGIEQVVKKLKKRIKLAQKAVECAYAYGTKRARYTYPTGKPKKAYKKALNEAYPNRSSWGKQTRAGASCDVFVGTCIRASGLDKKFPRGLDEQIPYLRKSKKWKVAPTENGKYLLKNLRQGDVIVWRKSSGVGHICIVVKVNGVKYIAEAGYLTKRWPVLAKKAKTIDPDDYKLCKVYRIKE